MRKLAIVASLLTAAVLTIAAAVAVADRGNGGRGGNNFRANLNGYNEVVGGPGSSSTGSVSTTGHGTFRARLRHDPDRLEFTLTYEDLEGGTVTAAHPHFAQRHVGASVFTFLCGGPRPACPSPSGTVTGTIVASDITGPAEQGVAPGEFDEFVRALRAGAVYVNVHTSPSFPEGEIRGQVNAHGHER